jgi:ABC-type antimicrobial peptide transport system ATPase subunit
MALLEIRNLVVEFQTFAAPSARSTASTLSVDEGEVLASSANPAPASRCRCWR